MADTSVNQNQEPPQKLSEGEFMRLFLTHEQALRAFARSILPDWGTVDDALQEASVTMWQKLGQLRDEDGFLPWAKVILRFKCLSATTVLRRDRRLLSPAVLELIADEAEAMDGHSLIHRDLVGDATVSRVLSRNTEQDTGQRRPAAPSLTVNTRGWRPWGQPFAKHRLRSLAVCSGAVFERSGTWPCDTYSCKRNRAG